MVSLKELGIVGSQTKAATIFEELVPDFRAIDYKNPSEYVSIIWDNYKAYSPYNKNLNGKYFEYILATLFIREEILPIYLNVKVAFVPNVLFDLMFYTNERGPICISAKTSLRERYKQADLETMALKQVHRRALGYLVTLDSNEARRVKEGIEKGDVIALDDILLATAPEFDNLIKFLKEFETIPPPTVEVITSSFAIHEDAIKLIK